MRISGCVLALSCLFVAGSVEAHGAEATTDYSFDIQVTFTQAALKAVAPYGSSVRLSGLYTGFPTEPVEGLEDYAPLQLGSSHVDIDAHNQVVRMPIILRNEDVERIVRKRPDATVHAEAIPDWRHLILCTRLEVRLPVVRRQTIRCDVNPEARR